ncbi:MAG: TldD/PmbA family protein [Candidatus Lokiarchaeota archaeon]|nr:TldD/PmbA family protein [Candidatus Lokiarchaeota archaeon]
MEKVKKQVSSFCNDWVIKGLIKLEHQIRFSNSQIDINKRWDEVKLDLFLSRKRRTLEITINDLSDTNIEQTLTHCDKLLNILKINTNFKKLPEGPFRYDSEIQNNIYDPKVTKLDEQAVDIVQEATDLSLKQGASRVAGTFFYGTSHFFLESNTGLKGNYKKSNLNFRIRAFADDMYSTGEAVSCSTHLDHGFNTQTAGIEAGEICTNAKGGKKGTPGIYNIIIYPKVSTELQAPTAAIAMNSYIKKEGVAWLTARKPGDKIAHESFSVWDDGTINYGLESCPFDDELVPSKNTCLIDHGILHQFFTNTSYSKKGEESTGNAGITMPKPHNTVFSTGDCTLKELMEISDKPTLLITSTWYTRYQSYAAPGIFSSIPKDGMFLVKKKGEILEPVRELRINSNHFHMLENIKGLGKELKQVTTWLNPSDNSIFAPFMLIGDVRMTTGTK